jgi:hypothetical protein
MLPIKPFHSLKKTVRQMCPLSGGDRGYDRDIAKDGQKEGDGQRHKGPWKSCRTS